MLASARVHEMQRVTPTVAARAAPARAHEAAEQEDREAELDAGDAPVASANLSLTALPGTRVSVGGQQYLTPVRELSLAPGPYQVTFRSATWDGPVSAQIVLSPGAKSHVHADFTNEPPRVVVR